MAVINANVAAGASTEQVTSMIRKLATTGAEVGVLFVTFEVAAADNDNSVYRLFCGLPANTIPLQLYLANDAITAGTVYHTGLYDADLGAEIDLDILGATFDLSTAHASLTPGTALDGLKSVAIENRGKRLWELAGHTIANKRDRYDIALTAPTVGTAAGTVSAMLMFALG
jgi:hypothetical protein